MTVNERRKTLHLAVSELAHELGAPYQHVYRRLIDDVFTDAERKKLEEIFEHRRAELLKAALSSDERDDGRHAD